MSLKNNVLAERKNKLEISSVLQIRRRLSICRLIWKLVNLNKLIEYSSNRLVRLNHTRNPAE
jgi:hypothetical protein